MKKIFVFILILSLTGVLFATDLFTEKLTEARSLLSEGFSKWDESQMQQALSQFQRLLVLERDTWLVHFYIAMAEYRIGIYYMSIENGKEQAASYYNDAVKALELCQAQNDTFPESYALLSACYGNLIGANPWKGITLGPRSGAAIDKAVQLAPDNPRIWFQKGIGSFYTPKMFGGGKEKALEELKRAIELYQKEGPLPPLYPQWGHDEAYAWLGQIYQEKGQFEEAKNSYEAGLQVNPENGWIRYQLLPGLENVMKDE